MGNKNQTEANMKKTYFESGQLATETSYVNKKKHWKSCSWYESGQLETKQKKMSMETRTTDGVLQLLCEEEPPFELEAVLRKGLEENVTLLDGYALAPLKTFLHSTLRARKQEAYQETKKRVLALIAMVDHEAFITQLKGEGLDAKEARCNSMRKEETYVNGKKHGETKSWYENGQVQSYQTFCNGKRHGVYKKWYKDGQLKVETRLR